MLNKLKQLWRLLNTEQKRDIVTVQLSVVFLAFFELFTIAAVAANMQLITNNEKLTNVMSNVDMFIGKTENEVLLIISFFLIVILTFSSLFSMLIFRKSTRLSMKIGHQIACKLLDFYLTQDWLYHANNNSSRITSNVLIESTRLTNGVLQPFVQCVSRVILIFIISTAIFIYDPKLSFFILAFFISSYLIISRFAKNRLKENSYLIQKSNTERVQSVNEAIDNIKMVILNDKKDFFFKKFEKSNQNATESQASNVTLSSAPRYMMEWLAFVSMILLIILTILSGRGLETIIPLLTIYGLAAFKLLPSLQQAYFQVSIIKGNISALEVITSELEAAKTCSIDSFESNGRNLDKVTFNSNILLKDVNFRYPNKKKQAISNLTIEIKKNKTIGLVGESGSGKSTLIDILCGLVELESGEFNVDGITIDPKSSGWKDNISYVPQTISLSDATIAENIAFGEQENNINWSLIKEVIELSCLNDLISSLEHGLNTVIGEKGVQLSGGQRQRIGIARALYKRSNILILDEATSALDGITENKIMEAVRNLYGKMTIIIIAHRLKTIKTSDYIYMLKDGNVIDKNTYEGLLLNNASFREMEKFA
ncbi:TPA: ABC transporter ATP-binding protein [Vibrio parahaemolyticus]|uniref:ABC transporter ATP-binding protein n=1 Tax=Vibrio parahaemolyticus TaxID=670 RepID=UPI001A8FA23D|nr:ABC transporter ATP-binding protein [Vibrio parahaemolyticus]MBO0155873.1 ABC transporter ATP-binding protein [Vibrio parahaemolyticus]MBO0171448.1 ABC transporter ATP-binding protein [Vibrio parahaemolyticus]MEA5284278.1 ABC transporter ATP-binding protein [Vibrio parahaemolyticus]HCE1575345.1 ABC transporter ATP-binding protein [Vibrio parahaemolyticus]HCG5288463.1 ABC transporter ATP-binding protein [Vibrio parahaemolyticus]